MLHEPFLRRCLELASFGRGRVGNGAMVGAVLVRNGKIIAEGYHRGFGLAHAERDLLERFTGDVEPSDVLYVNLEPCCHKGKTPPCTQIILDRGITTVVYGMNDPDPRVSGRGRALLEAKKVKVIGPLLRAQCEWFNRGFVSVRTKGRPWVTLKSARSPDGSIANPDGSPKKITSPEQDTWSHCYLRALSDAILLGRSAVEKDNPQLTVRYHNKNTSKIYSALIEIEKIDHKSSPYRIVLDPSFSIPKTSRILTDAFADRTIVIITPDTLQFQSAVISSFQKTGVQFFGVEKTKDGSFEWDQLWNVLIAPQGDYHGITSVLVEGGQKTWSLFLSGGYLDEDISLVGD